MICKMAIQLQKGKSVINSMILILFGICFLNTYSQDNFQGKYCKAYDLMDFSECLTFKADKTFKYNHAGDTGTLKYGEWEYKFIDKQIIVNYNTTESIKLGHHVSKIWTNKKDSINLK